MEHFDCSFVGSSSGHAAYIVASDAQQAAAVFTAELVANQVGESGTIYVRNERGELLREQAYAPTGLNDPTRARRRGTA